MGRLILSEFMTLDGVMEAPGFEEHRDGRNAWALRTHDEEIQRYNLDQMLGAGRHPARPDDVPDLGGVLADGARATTASPSG